MARQIGPRGFGVLAIAFAICRYAAMLADWGASTSGARDLASGEDLTDRLDDLRAWRRITGVLLAAGATAAAVGSGHAHIAPIALVIAARGLSADWISLGRRRHTRASAPALLQGATLATLSLAVSTEAQGAAAVGAAYSVAAALSIALNGFGRWTPRSVRVPGAWMLLAALAGQLMLELDVVLLGPLASAREAGVYAAVYRLPNAASTLVGLVLISALPTVTAVISQSPERLMELARRGFRASAVGSAAIIVIGIPTAVAVVQTLLGEPFHDGLTAVAILTGGVAVAVLAAPLHPLFLATGSDRRYATILTAAAGVNGMLNLAFIPRYGMVGAALATLVAQVQTFVHLAAELRRVIRAA